MNHPATGKGVHRLNVVKRHLRSELEERLFAQDGCMFAVTGALVDAITKAGLTRAEVAERIGKSQAFVSQVLKGSRNMTLKTAADILWACGLEVRDLVLVPIGETTMSRECMDSWLEQEHAERVVREGSAVTLHARRHAHVDAAFGDESYWARLTADVQHVAPVRFGVRAAGAGNTRGGASAADREALATVG